MLLLIEILSLTLLIYPLTVLGYSLLNLIFKLNWTWLPCGYNEVTFPVFMTCLFLFLLYMMLAEKEDYVARAVYGVITLFVIFNTSVFNIFTWVITAIFSFLLIRLVVRKWN